MYASQSTPPDLVRAALDAVASGAPFETLDDLPAAVYLTDAEGLVTYFNAACIDFAGRTPEPGKDRWCVTWKLYTEAGQFLPHDQCPMAVAIQERRPVRGVSALAERPDGTRVTFTPHPTPIFNEAGEFSGAVNVLIDVTTSRLRDQAVRCRRLARSTTDDRASRALDLLAIEYDEAAAGASPPHH